MAANRLSKLFRRSVPLPPDVEDALRRLGRLGEQQPELAELAAANAALLRVMYAHQPLALRVDIEPDHARTKQEVGLPLLRGEPAIFDPSDVRDQFLRLCEAIRAQGNTSALELGSAVKAGHFRVEDAVVDVIAGDPGAVARRADALGLDAGLAVTLLRLTLFPAMAQLAVDLRPLLDLAAWRRGYCPTCGSWPLLGEFRGLELTRFLRCGLCAGEWELDRLVCPFCDNRIHQDIKHWSVEGEEAKHRAMSCERCRGYVKQISTLAPIPAPRLLVEDLATLHLDLAALERNYAPPQ
ncbi:MAG TPA: formate dehydrogenase accessory protein FdhE [Herpetosiphonaceae bacterium]|nr:formate dehydrogenase accessory protein FdhE [Herpetosiphonaceae bacterium]